MQVMIVPLEPREFVPCGQQAYSLHPGLLCLHFPHPQGLRNATKSLLGTFSQVTLEDKPKSESVWKLRSYNNVEEELYVSGNTVVWSRGHVVLKAVTVDSLAKHVVWCEFIVNSDDAYQFHLPQAKPEDCEKISGFAVVAEGTVHVYTENGESYDTTLPFQVQGAWSFKFGLLFERRRPSSKFKPLNTSSAPQLFDNDLTTTFCLQHPLREFSPIITKSQSSVRYMNRPQDSVVFSEDDFIMTCDEQHGLHSVWRARKVSPDDVNILQSTRVQQDHQVSSICHMSLSSPGMSPFRGSYRGSPAAGYSSNSAFMGSNIAGPGINKTPHNNKNPSLAHLSYTPHSSKAFSPSGGSFLFQSHAFSPLRHSPHLMRSPCTPVSHESLCLNNSVHETAEPLRPEICFDHMWTETVTGTREGLSVGRATKVFRTRDMCDQSYVAYHVDSLSQLRLVRYSASNDCSHLIFGLVTSLPARDAIPLKDQNMLALLDLTGCIILYSGPLKVVKMNVSGIPMPSLSLSHGLHNTVSVSCTPQPISTPAHPSRPTSAMGNLDEVGQLSPVPELGYSGDNISILTGEEFMFSASAFSSKLAGIPHVVGSTIVVKLPGGSHYKVEIPQISSSEIVSTCLKALQYMLPNDVYLKFAIKWYSTRHAPGALNGRRAEWSLFVECLQEYLGYSSAPCCPVRPAGAADSSLLDMSSSPVIAPKKARPTVKAESKDWEYLLESKYNEEDDPSSVFITDNEQSILFLSQSQSYSLHKRKSMDTSLAGDSSLLTNQILTSVFCAIHLVYEEQKLSSLTWQNIPTMSPLLYRLASDLQQYKFLYSYALDNPTLFAKILLSKFQDTYEDGDLESRLPGYFSSDSKSCVFENLDDLVRTGSCKYPIPYIPGVTVRIERIFKMFDCLFNKGTMSSTVPLSPLMKTMFSASASGQDDVGEDKHLKMVDRQPAERVLLYMVNGGIDEAEITAWPPGVSLPILESLYQSCENPDLSLPLSALKLLGRTDLVEQTLPSAGDWKTAGLCPSTDPLRFAWTDQEKNNSQSEKDHSELISILEEGHQNTEENEQEKSSPSAGLDDNVTRLLFPNDHRMADAYNLLQSTKPMKILLTQEAGIDDREFMEQKEGRLAQLLNRSMALCIGRGMMMYRTQNPSAVDAVELPELELTGKDLNNATVSFANSNIELPSETFQWPRFHNGVAATLAIQDDKTSMSWVHINKERYTFPESSEPTFEHSGALFGFGLNHHLQELQTLNIHEYLQKSHEMTTIGLLLGLASDKCASCDLATMRLLSVHISALLPPTSTVLDIPHRVQAAAVMAVGFLCLGSSQRLVAEVMLREIDRFPSTETEVSPEREAYSLSSGFALGMVLLGKGDRMPELSDLNISEKLFHYMTGKHKRNYTYNRTHEYYSPSHSSNSNNFNQILEGDQVNTEVTCPGATMALALMFLKTNNQAVADWFIAPDTMSLLETIKPQHLMLRTMTRALILWDQVVPSVEWVESHIPFVIRQHLKDVQTMQVNHNDEDVDVDEHTILQCHVAIIAGACLALGLRFAGSQEKAAYVTLHHYVQFFISITKQPQMSLPSPPLEVIGHRLFETCLTSCLISMCMVVAGSGNLEGLQICRYLHHSVEGKINYGMQMATHMALGFLFLGGCRYSLSTSNKAIAALLVAIYPSFPVKSSDNRYHLQAFRHLYVMAVEKRLLVPIDVATKRPCYTQVAIQYLPTAYNNSPTIKMIAPCMLPEATYLQSIAVEDKRHLPVHVNVDKRPNKLGQITDDGIYVQLRPGFLPYVQDPKGHCTFLSRSRKRPPAPGNIKHSGDQLLSYLFSLSETDQSSLQKSNLSRLTSLLQEQRHHSKTFFLYLSLLQICCHIEDKMSPDPLSAWQIRLARNFISQSSNGSSQNNKNDPLMQAISVSLAKMFDNFVADKKSILQSVIFNRRSDASSRILTRSQSQHEKDQSILKEFRSSDLHKLACYLICNNLSLPLSDKTQQGFASPTKRRSRSKADESLSSILNQLKQLDNAQVPHLTAFQMLYC